MTATEDEKNSSQATSWIGAKVYLTKNKTKQQNTEDKHRLETKTPAAMMRQGPYLFLAQKKRDTSEAKGRILSLPLFQAYPAQAKEICAMLRAAAAVIANEELSDNILGFLQFKVELQLTVVFINLRLLAWNGRAGRGEEGKTNWKKMLNQAMKTVAGGAPTKDQTEALEW